MKVAILVFFVLGVILFLIAGHVSRSQDIDVKSSSIIPTLGGAACIVVAIVLTVSFQLWKLFS